MAVNLWIPPPDDWADVPNPEGGKAKSKRPKRVVLQYPNADAWVRVVLAPSYARHLSAERVWCPYWFRHAEARARLEALWRAWEWMRQDDEWLGNATWWRDYADPCMDRLLSVEGPFAYCKDQHSDDLPPLPCAVPDPGLFP